MTVLRVRKGNIADFKNFNLDAEQKAAVPYYVEVKYENLGTLKLERYLMDPSIEDTEGQEYKPLNLIIVSGTFKQCPNPSARRGCGPARASRCARRCCYRRARRTSACASHGDVLQDPYFWK